MKRVIEPTKNQVILADPTVISPDKAPDKMWHLFCHSLIGLAEYVSRDGKNWEFKKYVIETTLTTQDKTNSAAKKGLQIPALLGYAVKVLRSKNGQAQIALRPFIIKCENKFYLFYQEHTYEWKNGKHRLNSPVSKIKCLQSDDLQNWSMPKLILGSTRKFDTVGCPSVSVENHQFKLYFTYGQEMTGDNSLWEPVNVGYAVSNSIDSNYEIKGKVRIINKDNEEYGQIGSLRVRSINGKNIFSCNPIIRNKNKETVSKIYFCEKISDDVFKTDHQLIDDGDFIKYKLSDAYVADIAEAKDDKYIYFNVRRQNKFFDKLNFENGPLGVFIILMKNVLLNREDIYLVINSVSI